NGINSVRVNSPQDERYERKETAAGWSFNLRASNGQVIGTSEVYASVAAREKGIESVKANGPDSPVEDLT
ncbi:MAG: YegP family protein, partial [Flavobacteriales bacterium]|nr:YegP family protein [Flavobacteriales bacterium]